jgi:aminopeptidase N
MVHELAHQWFGDSVTPRDWGDIWLNEGFATYAEWLWRGAHGGRGPEATFRRLYTSHPAGTSFWRPAPAALYNRADLFGTPVYDRGAMTLQALRDRVGTKTFFAILKSWAHNYWHGTATTDDFIRLAERLSGKQLDPLFQDWLYTPSRPTGY